MAISHVISGLSKKYSEVLGDIHQLQDNLDDKQQDLAAIKTCIRLLDTGFSFDDLKPVRKRKVDPRLPKRTVPQLTGTYLRDRIQPGGQFKTTDVTTYILEERQITEKDPIAANIAISVYNYLRRQEKVGMLSEVRRTGPNKIVVWQRC